MVEIEKVEYIGSENIPKELARLEKMNIDPLNFGEVINQYRLLLKNLDTVARQELESHSKVMDEVKESVDKIFETASAEQWENNVWYKNTYVPMQKSLDNAYRAVAHFSTIIEIQRIIIKRLMSLVDGYKGLSEQRIIVETQRAMYDKLLDQNTKMSEKVFEQLQNFHESRAKSDDDRMSTIITAFSNVIGGKQQPSGQPRQTNLAASDRNQPAKTQHEKDVEMDAQEEPIIRDAVLSYLKENPKAHQNSLYKHVSDDTGVDFNLVSKVVKKMKDEGLVKSTGVAGSSLSAAEADG